MSTKKIEKILLFSLAFLIATIPLDAFAQSNNSAVYFEGGTSNFALYPGTTWTDTDLFKNFKNAMPGDVLTERILVRNVAPEYDFVKIYLRANAVTDDAELSATVAEYETAASMNDFLSQVNLKIYNGAEMLFNGAPNEATGNILLGEFPLGASAHLTAVLTVPIELGNEYAHRVGEVDWVFVVEGIKNEIEEPVEEPKEDKASIVINDNSTHYTYIDNSTHINNSQTDSNNTNSYNTNEPSNPVINVNVDNHAELSTGDVSQTGASATGGNAQTGAISLNGGNATNGNTTVNGGNSSATSGDVSATGGSSNSSNGDVSATGGSSNAQTGAISLNGGNNSNESTQTGANSENNNTANNSGNSNENSADSESKSEQGDSTSGSQSVAGARRGAPALRMSNANQQQDTNSADESNNDSRSSDATDVDIDISIVDNTNKSANTNSSTTRTMKISGAAAKTANPTASNVENPFTADNIIVAIRLSALSINGLALALLFARRNLLELIRDRARRKK